MKSAGNMVKQLHFMQSVFDQTGGGVDTAFLSASQIATLQKLYQRHFGD